MDEIIIKLDNVTFQNNKRPLVRNIDIDFTKKQITTLIGPNGAGKTTLAKLTLGLLEASSGEIYRAANLKMAYVPQSFTIDRALPMSVSKLMALNNSKDKDIQEYYLEQVGAFHLKNVQIASLSGGELQKVLLARAAAKQADFLVLDEPMQGVDYKSEAKLYELISKLRNEVNCSVLMVSHDLNIVQLGADRVICLDKTICCCGTPHEVAATEHYANLLGEKSYRAYNHHLALHDGI